MSLLWFIDLVKVILPHLVHQLGVDLIVYALSTECGGEDGPVDVRFVHPEPDKPEDNVKAFVIRDELNGGAGHRAQDI